jgi:ribosome-binding protein aMBF1 (putative translation factor)
MITGRQIREARALLGLQRNALAARVKTVTTATIARAETADGEPPITSAQATDIRSFLETVGIEFLPEDGGAASVRLRKST